MRKYSTEPRSVLALWWRIATPEMRKDLCTRVGCPENTIDSLAYGHRKMPRLDRALAIMKHCNDIRQEMITRITPELDKLENTSAVIPPLMTLQALVDGANRGER